MAMKNALIDTGGDDMGNLAMWEMLAIQKREEDLRFAEQQRIVRQASGDSSPSVWNRFLGWALAGRQGDRKPARA